MIAPATPSSAGGGPSSTASGLAGSSRLHGPLSSARAPDSRVAPHVCHRKTPRSGCVCATSSRSARYPRTSPGDGSGPACSRISARPVRRTSSCNRRSSSSSARVGPCSFIAAASICGGGRTVGVEARSDGAEGGTRTPTGCPTRPSNVRVCQFRHFGTSGWKRSIPQWPREATPGPPLRRSRGSSASRMPSPSRLYDSTVNRMAKPG
jgi:hypothetical protein